MKKYALTISASILLMFFIFTLVSHSVKSNVTNKTFWPIQSIDTMKYSRDDSADSSIYQKIPIIVSEVANLHANYISIDTPYDDQFYPVLKAWVDEARQEHLKIWFRGNFSAWEGWFGYQKFSNPNEDHALVHDFIIKHPDLFQNGDIFTSVPEAENGVIGDPRGSDEKTQQFNQFLITSYNNCVSSFEIIHKQVSCGYFSVNGDVAKEVLTPETIKQIGNVVVIDHYVDSSAQMDVDLHFLTNKFPNAEIILGEFGAPIPDINGDMNETQQAEFLNQLLNVFYENKNVIGGINYWVGSGGSTALYRDDNTEKPAVKIMQKYYDPSVVSGIVTNTDGTPLSNISIYGINNLLLATTDSNGNYSFPAFSDSPMELSISDPHYQKIDQIIVPKNRQMTYNIILSPKKTNIIYKIRLFINSLFNLSK